MNKTLFLIPLIFSLTSAFEVHKSNEFTKEVEPTKMSTSIMATIDDSVKLNIQRVFNKAIEGSKSEEICTNGSYRISPRYVYNKQKRSFVGYQGNISFKCEFEDSKRLDKVISKLDKISNKIDKLKLTINPISWIVDKKIMKQTSKELELEALHYAKSYKEFLSKEYETECKIKEVSLNSGNSPVYPVARHSMMSEMKSQTTEPIKSNHIIRYGASYKFECE